MEAALTCGNAPEYLISDELTLARRCFAAPTASPYWCPDWFIIFNVSLNRSAARELWGTIYTLWSENLKRDKKGGKLLQFCTSSVGHISHEQVASWCQIRVQFARCPRKGVSFEETQNKRNTKQCQKKGGDWESLWGRNWWAGSAEIHRGKEQTSGNDGGQSQRRIGSLF